MEEYVYEYSLWANKKNKTESYLFYNNNSEKKYKKGDTVIYDSHFKNKQQEIYLHQDMELIVVYDDDDIVFSKDLDYFHDEIISRETLYFNKPKHHAFVLLLRNGLNVLITYKDGERIHHGQIFEDIEGLKIGIEELLDF